MVSPNPDLKTLLADLQDSDSFVRSDAARLLAHIKDPQVVDAFINLLSDPDWRTRRNAAQALGVLKDRRAFEPLIAALADPIETMRIRAAVALYVLATELCKKYFYSRTGNANAWDRYEQGVSPHPPHEPVARVLTQKTAR